MHLQGAITTPQGNAPVTVADDLYFLMACGFYVQLHQDIFVVTDTSGFDFRENLSHQFRGPGRLSKAYNALPLAAAASNGFQAHPVFRILAVNAFHGSGQGLRQFLNGVQVHAPLVTGSQYPVCQRLQVITLKRVLRDIQSLAGTQATQSLGIGIFA